ncbi:MAG TPA: tetratricopeptide repeat protein [Terracidiphilus sp.]
MPSRCSPKVAGAASFKVCFLISHMGARHSNMGTPAAAGPTPARVAALSFLCALLLIAGAAGGFAQEQAGQSFEELSAQAAAARDRGDVPKAIDLYNRATQLKPDWDEGWWYLTLLQYSSNQFPGAIDAANHLLSLVPHAVPAMALRGLSEFETADYPSSLRDLETAVEHGGASDPHNEQIIRYHLALVLARESRFQDALEQYKALATKGVSDPELLVGLGLAGMRVTSFPSEIADQDKAVYQAAGTAGYAFLAGDTDQADTLFQQVLARYPTTARLHLFYGVLLFSHDPGLAADQFRDEGVIMPNDAAVRALLAYALVIAGRYTEALPEAQRVYAAAPEMEMAQLALGRSLGETGDVEGGVAMLEKVLKTDPDNLEAHIGLAALFAREGRRDDAYRERMLCLKLAK